MVSTDAYSWKEWNEGTATTQRENLLGVDLNENFRFLWHIISTGVGAANIEAGAVTAGAITANAVTQDHITWTGAGAVRAVQCAGGTDTSPFEIFACHGTAAVTGGATHTTVTIYFTQGVECTTGDNFSAAPFVQAYILTNNTDCRVDVEAAATNTAKLYIHQQTGNLATGSLYWHAYGTR